MGHRTAMFPNHYDAYRSHSSSRIYRIFAKVSDRPGTEEEEEDEKKHTITGTHTNKCLSIDASHSIHFYDSSFAMNRADFESYDRHWRPIFVPFLLFSFSHQRKKREKISRKQHAKQWETNKKSRSFCVNAQLDWQ